jgi:DNA-binding NarL/FixJ family response regulator
MLLVGISEDTSFRTINVRSSLQRPGRSSLEERTTSRMHTDGSSHRYTVVLADDHAAIMQRVSDLLTGQFDGEFDVVAAVGDGTKAIQAAVEFKPDILIVDICMPGLDGIQVAREIKRLGLSAKLILLTIQEDADYIEAARAIGASYVLKSRMRADLPLALEQTLAGRTFISHLSVD